MIVIHGSVVYSDLKTQYQQVGTTGLACVNTCEMSADMVNTCTD